MGKTLRRGEFLHPMRTHDDPMWGRVGAANSEEGKLGGGGGVTLYVCLRKVTGQVLLWRCCEAGSPGRTSKTWKRRGARRAPLTVPCVLCGRIGCGARLDDAFVPEMPLSAQGGHARPPRPSALLALPASGHLVVTCAAESGFGLVRLDCIKLRDSRTNRLTSWLCLFPVLASKPLGDVPGSAVCQGQLCRSSAPCPCAPM